METRLEPPPTKGKTSVARVRDDWYVACESGELGSKPRPVTILGQPMVLFRGEGGAPGALLDRCPHRNAPLSFGKVRGDNLQCGYHGWQFDRTGQCRVIPGLCNEEQKRGRAASAFACREQDGFVWVWATPDVEPDREPFRFPHLDDARYTTVRQALDMEGSVHAVAENALDVPHTAFLHAGLFRGTREPQRIDVVVRRWHDRVEAEYVGEPAPTGLMARLLAPRGGVLTHYDRFFLPSIAQVDYALGDDSHLVATTALTPISDFRTRLFGVVTFRLPVPGWAVAPTVKPVALRVLKQDADVLRRQTDVIRQFGGEQYHSTEIDALGPHILRLLRNAERGDRAPLSEPVVKTVPMEV